MLQKNWAMNEYVELSRIFQKYQLITDRQKDIHRPKNSVLAVVYNMLREVPRTLQFTLAPYQKEVTADDYEILLLDNGSSEPVVEDELLSNANWLHEPDNLYSNSVLADSSRNGLVGPINESNAFCLSKKTFKVVGGYDLRFKLPGGSTNNPEIFTRLVTRPNALNICLLSEGTFHLLHGGSARSHPEHIPMFFSEYVQVFVSPYKAPSYETMLIGRPRAPAVDALLDRRLSCK